MNLSRQCCCDDPGGGGGGDCPCDPVTITWTGSVRWQGAVCCDAGFSLNKHDWTVTITGETFPRVNPCAGFAQSNGDWHPPDSIGFGSCASWAIDPSTDVLVRVRAILEGDPVAGWTITIIGQQTYWNGFPGLAWSLVFTAPPGCVDAVSFTYDAGLSTAPVWTSQDCSLRPEGLWVEILSVGTVTVA